MNEPNDYDCNSTASSALFTGDKWISLNVESFIALMRDGEVSSPQWKVSLSNSAKQHAQDTVERAQAWIKHTGSRAVNAEATEQNRFDDMFPDPDSENSLKERIEELEEMIAERDQEEITRRQAIATLQREVKELVEVRAEEGAEKDERIAELEAFIDAKNATINQWCDRAESFGVDTLEGLMEVALDYRQSVTMLGGAVGGLYPAISTLKMKLVEVLTGRSELRAKRVREAAIAFKHACRVELDERTTSGRLHEMEATGRALDAALAE